MKRSLGLMLVMVVVGVAVGFLVGSGEVEEPGNEIVFGSEPGNLLSADQLAKDFESDELLALRQYAGKPLQIEGRVGARREDEEGNVLLILEGKQGDGLVRCRLVPGTEVDTAVVRKGALVVVSGFCEGKTDIINLAYCTVN